MNELAERKHKGDHHLPDPDKMIIDLMLAHKPAGMSESEFRLNRARYMARRREIALE